MLPGKRFLIGCLLASAIGLGAENADKSANEKPLARTTYVYKTVGDVKVEADVYRTEGTEARPVVVWFHGGALIVGSRAEVLAAVGKKVLTNTDNPAEAKGRAGYYFYLRQTGGWSLGVTGIDAVKEPGRLDRFCPVKQITRDYPPILMIHGTADTDVPYACSAAMARELTRQGVQHELLTVEGAGHGLGKGDPKRVAEVNARALEFIREQIAAK